LLCRIEAVKTTIRAFIEAVFNRKLNVRAGYNYNKVIINQLTLKAMDILVNQREV
jgi:hypothetical protein